MSTLVYIGLGSNLSDPQAQLERAIKAIADIPRVYLLEVSSFYRSQPMGPRDQPEYINAVASLETDLEAEALLDELQAIERGQGRVRDVRWGPRTLDLDILLYGDEVISSDRLSIPHPGLAEREFVLYPLYELDPELNIPERGEVVSLYRCCDANGIEKLEPVV